jgi:hypothetical protein
MGEPDLHPQRRTEQGERVIDVVAVADERDDEAREPPEPLSHREHVGERLAGMLAERQAVDHGDVGLRGELLDDRVRAGPGDDRVDEPLEVAGDVVDGLAGAHDRVLSQVGRVPAELVHTRLERDACPKARLLEEQRERPPDERRGRMAARLQVFVLQVRRQIEDPQHLVAAEVRDREQVAAAQRPGLRGDVHALTLAGTGAWRDPPSVPARGPPFVTRRSPITTTSPDLASKARTHRSSTTNPDSQARIALEEARKPSWGEKT